MNPDTTRRHIIETSRATFTEFGFSKVTMDDLAEKLGMSKKTLYKHFPSKDALLQTVMRTLMREMQAIIECILDEPGLDFTGRLIKLMHAAAEHLSKNITRPLLVDLQKHAPHLWKEVEAFRRQQIHEKFTRIFQQGAKEGVFRRELDQQIVLLVYMNAVQNIMNPRVLSELPQAASDVFWTIIRIIFGGILTEAARGEFLKDGIANLQLGSEG